MASGESGVMPIEVIGNESRLSPWSLGCDVTIEEVDATIQEIRVKDIALSSGVIIEDFPVNISEDGANVMDLDVSIVVDGLNSTIKESQVVPYDRIDLINDLSPESTYEKGFAASAKSVKKVKDSVDSLDNNVKSNTSNISKVATDIESLTRRVDRLSEGAGGEDLGGIWYIDELTGNLVTDKQVEIKSNLIVAGDTSTGRTGEDPGVAGGFLGVKVGTDEYKTVTPDGLLDMTDAFEDLDVDLSDYYTKTEVDNKIPSLEGYAKTEELDKYLLKKAASQEIEGDITIKGNLIVTGDTSTGGTGEDVGSGGTLIGVKVGDNTYAEAYTENGILNLTEAFNNVSVDLSGYYTREETDAKIAGLSSTYATKLSLAALQTEVDNIESVLGMDEEAEGIINTWNEVKAFLDGYSSSDDLVAILSGMNADIATRALGSDLDALAVRVGENESAISDNATNIRNAKGEIDSLKDTKADWGTTIAHYGITDAYTKNDLAAYKTWWDDLMSLIVKEGNDIKIKTNLIVAGDTSTGGTGSNPEVAGTLIGIKVNGETYKDPVNGILTIPDYPTSLEWSAINGKPTKLTEFTNDAGFITSAALVNYLPKSGGTLTGALTLKAEQYTGNYGLDANNSDIININAIYTSDLANKANEGIQFARTNGNYDSLWAADGVLYFSPNGNNPEHTGSYSVNNTIYHSGNFNPADYLPLSGGTISGALTVAGDVLIGTTTSSYGKLQVDGGAKITFTNQTFGTYSSALGLHVHRSEMDSNNAATAGILVTAGNNKGGAFSAGPTGVIISYYDGSVFSSQKLAIHPSGNVSVGVLSDMGYSLGIDSGRSRDTLAINSTSSSGPLFRLNQKSVTRANLGVAPSSNYGAWYTYIDGSVSLLLGTNGKAYIANEIDMFSDKKEILNTGNYSDHALPLSGGTMTGTIVLPNNKYIDSQDGASMLGITTGFGCVVGVSQHPLRLRSDGTATINDYTIIHSGNIGSQYVAGLIKSDGNAYVSYNATYGYVNVNGVAIGLNSNTIERVTSGKLYIQKNVTEATIINQYGGNVGIGTDSPVFKLDVAGAVRATGGFKSPSIGIECDANGNTSGYGSEINRFGANLYLQNREGNLYLSHTTGTTYIRGLASITGAVTISGQTTINNNLIVAGDTATGSDIRFKDKLSDHSIALSDIANAPLFTFTWNDREDDSVHLGSSAQYWEKVAPWLVKGEDFKTLDYSTLGVAIGISLANKTLNLEDRVKILEKENKALKEQIRRIQYGS